MHELVKGLCKYELVVWRMLQAGQTPKAEYARSDCYVCVRSRRYHAVDKGGTEAVELGGKELLAGHARPEAV